MIFNTTDEFVVREACESLKNSTAMPPFRIMSPGGSFPASGRVVRIKNCGPFFEIETDEKRETKAPHVAALWGHRQEHPHGLAQ